MAAMEIHGVYVDVERWRSILAVRTKQKAEVEANIQQVLGSLQGHNQSKACSSVRETSCGTSHLIRTTHAGAPALGVYLTSTTKEALQDVQHQHPVIAQILEWKALENSRAPLGRTCSAMSPRMGVSMLPLTSWGQHLAASFVENPTCNKSPNQ